MQKAVPLLDEDLLRTLHIGEVAFSYYNVQRSSPTEQDYKNWLAMLPELLKNRYGSLGFEDGKNSLDFHRYFADLRKKEMVAYMRENLNPEDFSLWLEKKDTPSSIR